MWRLASLITGLLALWIAVGSPLATLDHHLLTAHMAQHLLIMTVAAPLILRGAPAMRLPGRMIHPAICWLAGTTTVIAWHVPALFELGMRSAPWHAFEHAAFFTAGLLFWWPVIEPRANFTSWSRWGVPLYLFLATLPCDALSAFLTFCDRVVYPHYLSAHPPLRYLAARRPAVRGRADVGVGHVCLPGSRSRDHHAHAFTAAARRSQRLKPNGPWSSCESCAGMPESPTEVRR